MTNLVNDPDHYPIIDGVRAADICDRLSFNLGNALKYLWRAGKKGPAAEDYRKAAWYLRREGGLMSGYEYAPHGRRTRELASTVLDSTVDDKSRSLAFRRLLFAIADGHLDHHLCLILACDLDSEAALCTDALAALEKP